MPLGLFDKKADIVLTTDKAAYTVGEEVHATVHVKTDAGLEVRGGKVRVGYTAHALDRKRQRNYGDDRGSHTSTVDEVDEVEIGSQKLVPGGLLAGGSERTVEAAFTLPMDALPSGKGHLIRVEWWAKANLDIPHGRDPKGEAALTVSVPASAYQSWDRQPAQCSSTDCTMSFSLQAHEFKPGDTIAGTLNVLDTQELSSSGIRVDLLRVEVVGQGGHGNWTLIINGVITTPGSGYDLGNSRTDVMSTVQLPGSDHVAAGIPQQMSFQVPVPADAIPTMRTPRGEVRWLLKASVNRRLRSDYTLAEEVVIYGPAAPIGC